MSKKANARISKSLSSILRHNPEIVNVVLDSRGFTDLETLVANMNTINPWREIGLQVDDVLHMIDTEEKVRFEVVDGRIRALSGHSIQVEIDGEDYYPTGPLYFGTTSLRREEILSNGLTAGSKILVRLSSSYDAAMAICAARPPKGEPFVVEVDAQALANDGWSFKRLSNGEIVTAKFGSAYVSDAAEHKPNSVRQP